MRLYTYKSYLFGYLCLITSIFNTFLSANMSSELKVPIWVTKIPISHRGLHDHKKKIYENTLSAF